MTRLAWTRQAFLRGTAAALALGASGRAGAGGEVYDVVVIGGGLAGLTAARRLGEAGISSVAVVEARERVGGRTVNLDLGLGEVVEGGGEWIGPSQDRIAALADEVAVARFPAFYDGSTTYDIQGHVSRGLLPDFSAGQFWDFLRVARRLDGMAKALPRGRGWEASNGAELDGVSLGGWLRQNDATPWTHAVFKLITRAIIAGYPDRVSLLWFLNYASSAGGVLPLLLNDGGAQDLRFEGGSQLVSIRVAEALGDRVHLGRPVERVVDLPGQPVVVHTRSGRLQARRVVVAMMPADLLRIRFEPALPARRMALNTGWARLCRLPIVKASVLYATPFWRQEGLNGAMQSDHGPVQLIFDNSPQDGSIGVLTCFLSITEALALVDGRTRQAELTKVLVRYFGEGAARVTGYVEKDWATDPWSTGCITPLPPGLLSQAGAALREPVGRVHWAGTETSDIWGGFMDGAVRSGERAAAEVVQALGA